MHSAACIPPANPASVAHALDSSSPGATVASVDSWPMGVRCAVTRRDRDCVDERL